MKILILGTGAFGTALGSSFASKGLNVLLLGRKKELTEEINTQHRNSKYLPNVSLSAKLQATTDIAEAFKGRKIIISALPSQKTRETLEKYKQYLEPNSYIVCVSKGIEQESLYFMSQVFEEVLKDIPFKYAILSGPSFAAELAKELPTYVVLASKEEETACFLQEILNTPSLRVYTSTDVLGVELGGAGKNVIALVAGCSEGLSYGLNTQAAIITRGLAELARMGKCLNAKQETFAGLSGLGDLSLTCTGNLSRNRSVGIRLGQGETLEQIMQSTHSVAEGVHTCLSLYHLSLKYEVELPMTRELYKVLYEKQELALGLQNLWQRKLRPE